MSRSIGRAVTVILAVVIAVLTGCLAGAASKQLIVLILVTLGSLTAVALALVRPASSAEPPRRSARRPGAPGAGQAGADRAELVQACIYVRDRITSVALAERLGAALRQAGVTPIEPTGVRFDPTHHEAGGATPTDDPVQVGTVAAVEVPGYADRGHVLRAPVVTVYQANMEDQ